LENKDGKEQMRFVVWYSDLFAFWNKTERRKKTKNQNDVGCVCNDNK